ncbi:uncharacterized protein [Penaeus vannamei]|uniref:uncharacterized protein n=1 Tax=Penaeus vannamei TaxID=6689 RepID=UPI00387F85A2
MEAHPPLEVASAQAACIPGPRGGESGAEEAGEKGVLGPPRGRAGDGAQGREESACGQNLARGNTSEPGGGPAPGGQDQLQRTPVPSIEYLRSTAWETIHDDQQLDDHTVVYDGMIQGLPSAGDEVVYYWDPKPTGIRDPNTGLEF